MKINMPNIVEGAILRGLSAGYLEVKDDLRNTNDENAEFAAITKIAEAVLEELDFVIDFSDDEDDEDMETSNPVGFAQHGPPADAVGSPAETPEPVEPEDEEQDSDLQRSVRHHRRIARFLKSRRSRRK